MGDKSSTGSRTTKYVKKMLILIDQQRLFDIHLVLVTTFEMICFFPKQTLFFLWEEASYDSFYISFTMSQRIKTNNSDSITNIRFYAI